MIFTFPLGTFANIVAVLLGSFLGAWLHQRFPAKIKTIVFEGLGLITLLLGLQMALKVEKLLPLIFSILLGGILGQALDLEHRLEKLGNWTKAQFKTNNTRFVEGMVTPSLLFCVGSMAILGSFDEGLRGDRSILYTKSILDGFAAIAFASTFGWSVLFSTIPLLIYQGGLTLFAGAFQNFFSPVMIHQLTATGGLLLVGLGLDLLGIKKINTTNLLPSLLFIVFFSIFLKG